MLTTWSQVMQEPVTKGVPTSPGCSENYCLMGTSQNSGAT